MYPCQYRKVLIKTNNTIYFHELFSLLEHLNTLKIFDFFICLGTFHSEFSFFIFVLYFCYLTFSYLKSLYLFSAFINVFSITKGRTGFILILFCHVTLKIEKNEKSIEKFPLYRFYFHMTHDSLISVFKISEFCNTYLGKPKGFKPVALITI